MNWMYDEITGMGEENMPNGPVCVRVCACGSHGAQCVSALPHITRFYRHWLVK